MQGRRVYPTLRRRQLLPATLQKLQLSLPTTLPLPLLVTAVTPSAAPTEADAPAAAAAALAEAMAQLAIHVPNQQINAWQAFCGTSVPLARHARQKGLSIQGLVQHLVATATSLGLGTSQTQAVDNTTHVLREVGFNSQDMQEMFQLLDRCAIKFPRQPTAAMVAASLETFRYHLNDFSG